MTFRVQTRRTVVRAWEEADRERFAEIAQSTPLRYAVEHDELARLAVFLTSDLARAITGQMILADAGAFLSRTRPPNQRPES